METAWRATIAAFFCDHILKWQKIPDFLMIFQIKTKIINSKVLQRNQPAGIHSETALRKYLLLRGFWFYHWLRSCVWNLQGNFFLFLSGLVSFACFYWCYLNFQIFCVIRYGLLLILSGLNESLNTFLFTVVSFFQSLIVCPCVCQFETQS